MVFVCQGIIIFSVHFFVGLYLFIALYSVLILICYRVTRKVRHFAQVEREKVEIVHNDENKFQYCYLWGGLLNLKRLFQVAGQRSTVRTAIDLLLVSEVIFPTVPRGHLYICLVYKRAR